MFACEFLRAIPKPVARLDGKALGRWSQNAPANCIGGLFWGDSGYP